jgi:hypothetical protein
MHASRYEKIRALETAADITIYPLIEVERLMCNRNEYMRVLQAAKTQGKGYQPLDWKLGAGKSAASSSSGPAAAAASAPVVQSASVHSVALNCEIVHFPLNGLTPPTVLLPSSAQVLSLSQKAQGQLVERLCAALMMEATVGEWNVKRGEWVLKGVNDTEGHVVETKKNVQEILKDMKTFGANIAGCVSDS